MAIQIPNPGTGNGASGDNEFVLWSKVKDNFSNTTHAASRLVGNASGNVLTVGSFGLGSIGIVGGSNLGKANDIKISGFNGAFTAGDPVDGGIRAYVTSAYSGDWVWQSRSTMSASASPEYRYYHSGTTWSPWFKYYTENNTTKEPTTGYLKAASPILHLFNDDLVKEHEAVEQDITVEKLGTGEYLIKGSTGLSNEGWNLSPPKDIHGNALCMVEATEADGNINVKTYKRKFDFDIVAIVPDYDQPFDIPTGHSVDLRLNDLPQETQTEV